MLASYKSDFAMFGGVLDAIVCYRPVLGKNQALLPCNDATTLDGPLAAQQRAELSSLAGHAEMLPVAMSSF